MIDNLYIDLFNIEATSGFEAPVRKYFFQFIKEFSNFKISTDKLGSTFAIKKSKNKNAQTVMFAAHFDEVGLIVADILKNGLIKLQPIGGLNPEVFTSQVLNVHTKTEVIKGVVGSIPPHLKLNNSKDDVLLDVGAQSREEVFEFGISLGDMVLFDNPFSYTKNKKRVISKAVDNRYGCGIVLEIIREFNDVDLPFNLVVGATVQEEVGLRGAATSIGLIKPDLFIAIDASPVNDMLDENSLAKLGGGFLLRLYDPRNVINIGFLDYIRKLAIASNIRHQDYVSKGGTDAARVFDMQAGIPATTIGLPARYIHSTAGMFQISDLDEVRKICFKMITNLDDNKITMIKEANR